VASPRSSTGPISAVPSMCARWTRARDDRVSSNRGHLVRRWRGVHVVWRGCRFGRGYAVGAAHPPAGGAAPGAGLRRWRPGHVGGRWTRGRDQGVQQPWTPGPPVARCTRRLKGLSAGVRVRGGRRVRLSGGGSLGRGCAGGAVARRPRGGTASSAWCPATVATRYAGGAVSTPSGGVVGGGGGYAGGAVCTSSGGIVGSGAGTRWAPRTRRWEDGSPGRVCASGAVVHVGRGVGRRAAHGVRQPGTPVARCARRPEGVSVRARVRGGRRVRVGWSTARHGGVHG